MSGVHGSYWFLLNSEIVLEKIEYAVSRVMRITKVDDPRINVGAFQASPGTIRSHQEASAMHLE